MRARRAAAALLMAAPLAAALGGCDDLFVRDPGERLWRKLCAECHGLDGAGNTPRFMGNAAADLTDDYWKSFGGDRYGWESAVREGVFGQMPAFDQLSREEMKALLDHLARLRGESP